MFNLDQVMIFLLGPLAVWLSQDKRYVCMKWASVIGLLSAPFWFHAAIIAGQWGILAAHCIYTYSWARGFKHYWIDKDETA
jgi:hypothetical protein